MANKTLFQTIAGALLPRTNAVNEAGGVAYALTPKETLAQYAATGCLNGTFYACAEDQMQKVLALADHVDAAFVAQVAIYARQACHMKDMPALLCAWLAAHDVALLKQVFSRVCNNGKMVRTFVQILRSGVVGRKSLGTAPKKLVLAWLNGLDDEALLAASVGNDPSLADLVKMVHPKPVDPVRRAAFAWLIGKPYEASDLPPLIASFEAWKADRSLPVPEVPFLMLAGLPLGTREWTAIARRLPWQATRMNLATLARNGVFADAEVTALVAARLRDREAIAKARVLPYQLLVAFTSAGAEIPGTIREALQDAMEIATQNVPEFTEGVVVCPDVSGSMHSPVTGFRGTATTAVKCIDVAALVSASILRTNRLATVIPFSDRVVRAGLNPRDSVMTNARVLAGLPSGGTDCSLPLAELNRRKAKAGLVILVSDNESWIGSHGRGTAVMREWQIFAARNRGAKLICLDIQPGATTQAPSRADILNVGGFSDAVFSTIAAFAAADGSATSWVEVIERTAL